MPRKQWNRYKYILATNRPFFCHEKPCPTASPSPKQSDIPKWEQLPNQKIIIQTHLLQSMPPQLPRGTDKGPICVIKSAEPKYIFFPPKNAPRRAQKCETVSRHLGNADYHVPTLFTLVYKCHQTHPTVSWPCPPIWHPRQANQPTCSPKGAYY